ncbi:ABC transporter ATP-binding protein [Bacillus toyonensis]|uniref:ABC transporter ATP-binding protein n=1 Tax=Bacillus toyonensis TaxID=155322 RepID=UPI002E225754|nr:ATP-binding cassette domain-containing protein [Bacillus toyonensis]MED2737180.1 ATP-binding cassette domain-containing protein [Bacillus toyonensis]
MSLTINNLIKRYGQHTAVNNLSFHLPSGEVLGLLGRNGAGKTTTIKTIMDLIPLDAGTILWNDKPLNRKELSIGYLPEERGLYPKVKVGEQLKYFGKLEGMSSSQIKTAIDYWLERFQITDYRNKLVGELSKGNQQKVQIIGTLLHDPQLIILDEPFSGLDPINATLLSDVIEELISKEKTIILSSHQMGQIESFCQNVVMMKNGEVMVSGQLQQIKDDYGYKNLKIQTKKSINKELKELKIPFEQKELVYTIQVTSEKEGLNIINQLTKKNVEFHNFSLLEPSLHQIFVERVK